MSRLVSNALVGRKGEGEKKTGWREGNKNMAYVNQSTQTERDKKRVSRKNPKGTKQKGCKQKKKSCFGGHARKRTQVREEKEERIGGDHRSFHWRRRLGGKIRTGGKEKEGGKRWLT